MLGAFAALHHDDDCGRCHLVLHVAIAVCARTSRRDPCRQPMPKTLNGVADQGSCLSRRADLSHHSRALLGQVDGLQGVSAVCVMCSRASNAKVARVPGLEGFYHASEVMHGPPPSAEEGCARPESTLFKRDLKHMMDLGRVSFPVAFTMAL